GDADGGGLAQLSGGATSLEAELAKSIAADNAVVDVSKLFRQTAQASADFTSGWATGKPVDERAMTVIPLENLVGKRFYHAGQAHQVVDYGPLDQAAYQVKNLVSGAAQLLAASTVKQAPTVAADAPLSLIPETTRPASGLPAASPLQDTGSPLWQQYRSLKQQHPNAILFFQLGDFYETFDQDAETIARELEVVLTSRMIGDRRVPMAGVPCHAAQSTINRLIEKGHPVAVCDQVGGEPIEGVMPRQVVHTTTFQPAAAAQTTGHALPTTLDEAYQRFRETRQRNVLTFVEMPDSFVTFDGDAITASQRLFRLPNVAHFPNGPTLKVLTLKRDEHESTIQRLLKARCTVALANGSIRILHPEPQPVPEPAASLHRPIPAASKQAIPQGQLALF
ncbi:MAG: hypothetical protein JXB07_04380, partial [Anaerolineae bacterium]|nr:hypothetical protein [Anaerolineae bacterium]